MTESLEPKLFRDIYGQIIRILQADPKAFDDWEYTDDDPHDASRTTVGLAGTYELDDGWMLSLNFHEEPAGQTRQHIARAAFIRAEITQENWLMPDRRILRLTHEQVRAKPSQAIDETAASKLLERLQTAEAYLISSARITTP